MHHPYIIGETVYLRGLERADLGGPMFQWANDPEVTHYMYMGTFPNTIEGLEREYDMLIGNTPSALIQAPGNPLHVTLAIVDKQSDIHIGNIGFYGISWLTGVAELRTIIGEKSHWGGGWAAEAYLLALRYAFDRLNLRRIWAGCRADHLAAVVALENAGFVREGRQRQHFLRNGRAYDILLYGLMSQEFKTLFPAQASRPPVILSSKETESQ
jgi:RimJ/RimL family protein N-acetyltransferase